jgi:hypothetical protein
MTTFVVLGILAVAVLCVLAYLVGYSIGQVQTASSILAASDQHQEKTGRKDQKK